MKPPFTVKEYFLVAPGKFEMREAAIDFVPDAFMVLSPIATAICGSDIHYYRGEKSEKKLKERLPLILLHEGVCIDRATGMRVVPQGGYSVGVPEEFVGQENIWPDLPYLGATNGGLARSHLLYPKELTVPVPDAVTDEVASLTEPFSIALRAIYDLGVSVNDSIAVIGTGGIAYLLVLALRFSHNIPRERITVFGVHDGQLAPFQDLAQTFDYKNGGLGVRNGAFTHVFEAVGGRHMPDTIKTAFGLIRPGGKIGILGISDLKIDVPLGKLVNHGITLRGLTRSTAEEYAQALKLFSDSDVHAHAAALLDDPQFMIRSAADLVAAFDRASEPGSFGRVIVHWPAT